MAESCTRCKADLPSEYTVVTRCKQRADGFKGPDGLRYSVGVVDPAMPDAALCDTCASFVDAAIAGRPCFSRGET